MAISPLTDILSGVNRSAVMQALQKPGQTPSLFKEVLKKLNLQLGLSLETPSEVLAVKFLKQRFDKNPVLQTKYGSFENFLKSVDLQKIADKIESRLLTKNFAQVNFDSKELKELGTELDQELESTEETNSETEGYDSGPDYSLACRQQEALQKTLLGINDPDKALIESIQRNRLRQNRDEQKLMEKRQANKDLQKKEIAKAELHKDRELAVLRSKKITSPVALMTQKEMILGSFESKKLQVQSLTA
jgi:hypothetical protein